MKKLLPTFLFYALSFLIIFILDKLSPGAHDGGLGLGAIALVVFIVILLIMIFLNIYKVLRWRNYTFS